MKRSTLTDAGGIPLGVVLAPANAHDSPLLAPTLDLLDELGPLPERMTVHLDRGYDSDKIRTLLAERGLEGEIAQRGLPAPIQAGMRWPVERTHAWGNAFNRLQRCYERCEKVVDAFFSLDHTIITLRRLIVDQLPLGPPTPPPPLNATYPREL
jgi:transposase